MLDCNSGSYVRNRWEIAAPPVWCITDQVIEVLIMHSYQMGMGMKLLFAKVKDIIYNERCGRYVQEFECGNHRDCSQGDFPVSDWQTSAGACELLAFDFVLLLNPYHHEWLRSWPFASHLATSFVFFSLSPTFYCHLV
jgi:hypothetical protein